MCCKGLKFQDKLMNIWENLLYLVLLQEVESQLW